MHLSLLLALLAPLGGCPTGTDPSDDAGRGRDGSLCSSSEEDEPDSADCDANGDGIDGDVRKAVFVAPDGNDTASGTREAPVRSIVRAISVASASGKTQILVAAGTYTEMSTVRLSNGISLYGGYDRASNWSRGEANTVLNGPTIAIEATGIRTRTVVARLTVRSAANTDPSGSSVVVKASDANGLVLTDRLHLIAGRGANGRNGEPGRPGNDGNGGSPGGGGAKDSQSSPGAGGPAGTNPECPAANGGAGGRGGESPTFTGLDGRPANGGAGEGAGGTADGCTPENGTDGRSATVDGGSGPVGTGGAATGSLDMTTALYSPANGTSGEPGIDGKGGGGGGGSSGQGGGSCVDGSGNGGGGGGAGGCGGTGGQGGGGGGASIGVIAVNSPMMVIEGITIETAGGGNGGTGGTGGTGGMGATGAVGGALDIDQIGRGGKGGDGRPGGGGGAGGGGGGGPSVGVWARGMPPQVADVTFRLGMPGTGGASPGNTTAAGKPGGRHEVAR